MYVLRFIKTARGRFLAVVLSTVLLALSFTVVSAQDTGLESRVSNELLSLAGSGSTDIGARSTGLVAAPVVESSLGNLQPGSSAQFQPLMVIEGRSVLVDISSSGDVSALVAELQALGMQNISVYGNIVSGYLPISSIFGLQDAANLQYARAAYPEVNTGSVAGEAIEALAVDIASGLYGVDGSGLAIGILSDSFDCGAFGGLPGVPAPNRYADDVASGDLPPGVIILEDIPCGTDEGRGMAQLVHDLAPGAQILFHTAFSGEAGFAQGIIDLADAGADVIVDDVRYFAEPVYMDGIIAQAADEVYSRGIPYFSSAGNSANQGYEAPFNGSGIGFDALGSQGAAYLAELHDFDPGPGVDLFSDVSISDGGSSAFVLQWDDPFASVTGTVGADSDFDFHLFSQDQTIYYGCIFCNDNIDGDPVELFSATGPFDFAIAVGLRVGTNPDALLNIYSSSSTATLEYFGSPTTWGHANADGAIAVGAAFWGTTPAYGENPPLVNSFSSYGGVPILFDTDGNRLPQPELRPKPEITATDGSNTTFFFSDSTRDEDTLPNFFGTSAAAPHAAAIAILMLEANPSLTPDEILLNMQLSAIDIVGTNDVGGPVSNRNISLPVGFDNVSGAGLIQADVAIQLSINSPSLTCNGLAATIYVENGVVVGGPLDGQVYQGILRGTHFEDVIVGTNVDDQIRSSSADDVICGFAGDDTILPGNSNDTVYAGPGNDTVNGGNGNDTIYGEDGNDTINGGNDHDTIDGGDGDDTITGSNGNDVIDGGEGNDDIRSGNENDTVNAGPGIDYVNAGNGNDVVYGGDDNDEIRAGNGNDEVHGDGGNDVIFGQNGEDDLYGGPGEDEIRGGNDNDDIFGGDDNDVLFGNNSNDNLDGGDGDDLCNGASGNDTAVNCETVVSAN